MSHPEVIFTTIHGRHLYGWPSPFSDVDTFTVTTSNKGAHHVITRDGDRVAQDRVTIGWEAFLSYARSGSHQSLEALFSPYKEWHSREYFEPFLEAHRVCGEDVFAKYKRTITKFSHAQDFKRRRHACRLWLNLQDLRRYGRFNPRMPLAQWTWATELAASDTTGDELALLLHEGVFAGRSFLWD